MSFVLTFSSMSCFYTVQYLRLDTLYYSSKSKIVIIWTTKIEGSINLKENDCGGVSIYISVLCSVFLKDSLVNWLLEKLQIV